MQIRIRRIIFLSLILYYLLIRTEGITAETNLFIDNSTKKELYKESFVNEETPGKICHVSSIVNINKEKTICVWYSGSREGAKDVAIYKAIFDEKEMKWNKPEKLIDRITATTELKMYVKKIGNPMLMKDLSGKIWLFYSSAAFGGWSMTSLNYKTTQDGITWTKSKKLLLSPFFNLNLNVKNDGINVNEETFIIPAYGELFKKLSYIIKIDTIEEDAQIYKIPDSAKAIQPVILPDKDSILLFFRNTSKSGKKFILTTKGILSNWKELSPTQLPNPDSGFDMIRIDESIILGVINYSFSNRENLSIVVSADNGKSWKVLKILEQKEGKEYSYPSIAESSNGLYHITYTYERKKIKHIVFNKTWLYNRINELGLPYKKSPEDTDHLKISNKLTMKLPITTKNLIFKEFSEISHNIAVTLTTVLFISAVFLRFGKITGLNTKILLILSLLAGTLVVYLPINHLTLKDYLLTLSPSLSCSTLIFVIIFFLSEINCPIDKSILFHFSIIIFAISVILYSSFFGFIKMDIYSFGYNYIYFLGILSIIAVYYFSRRPSVALLSLAYMIFFIIGAPLTSNIFDTFTDGFAFFISLLIILNQMKLKRKAEM